MYGLKFSATRSSKFLKSHKFHDPEPVETLTWHSPIVLALVDGRSKAYDRTLHNHCLESFRRQTYKSHEIEVPGYVSKDQKPYICGNPFDKLLRVALILQIPDEP